MKIDTIEAVARALPLIDCCTPLAGSTLSDGEAQELERLFRALGDRNRLKIINILVQAAPAPVCVCELVPSLDLAQPTVSYHLKQLSDAGLVERERRGTFAYYRLSPLALERVGKLFERPPLAAAG